MKPGSPSLAPPAEVSAIHPLLGLEDAILLGLSRGRSRVPRDNFVLSGPLGQSHETPRGKLGREV